MEYRKRAKRIRKKVKLGTRPRLSVFLSGRHVWAQVIDDKNGHTLASAHDGEVGGGKTVEVAGKVGELLAQKALLAKVKKVVFDRGGRKYHGRIKALAQGARKGGLEF